MICSMTRFNGMTQPFFQPSRRDLLTGLGVFALPAWAKPVKAGEPPPWALRSRLGAVTLRTGEPATAAWSLDASRRIFKRGDVAQIVFANDLPISVVLNWRGIGGASASEPLLVRPALAHGASETFALPLRDAGTCLCDFALLGDDAALPSRSLPFIVAENEPVPVDRDEVFLIEGWRLRPDGSAIAPGRDPAGTMAVYTVNGEVMPEIHLRGHERLRIRLINGLQRNVTAVKIENDEVAVMALDGQPTEPFLARNGALVLAPGSRADVFINARSEPGRSSILLHDGEAAHPIAHLVTSDESPLRKEALPLAPALPSNGLPSRLDLKTALRADLVFGSNHANWVRPAAFTTTTPPAFGAGRGRTVVLSLINRATTTAVFHLHGHHFRLLDRLDDGWKPFWLDTIAIDADQTQRIAFAADHVGGWLIEATEARWEAQRFVRWYSVE
jgi:FtsP/CotA-like multicopper oxidase with cupredoxin domain